MFASAKTVVPDKLKLFTKSVIIKKKKRSSHDDWLRKCTTIEHAIISATKPGSILSMLHVGLSVYLHRHYGSRNLIVALFSLGICAFYAETILYESSLIQHDQHDITDGAFMQFLFDNADFNTRTLDGHGTFHCMGGVQCVASAESVSAIPSFARLNEVPTALDVAKGEILPKYYSTKLL